MINSVHILVAANNVAIIVNMFKWIGVILVFSLNKFSGLNIICSFIQKISN